MEGGKPFRIFRISYTSLTGSSPSERRVPTPSTPTPSHSMLNAAASAASNYLTPDPQVSYFNQLRYNGIVFIKDFFMICVDLQFEEIYFKKRMVYNKNSQFSFSIPGRYVFYLISGVKPVKTNSLNPKDAIALDSKAFSDKYPNISSA